MRINQYIDYTLLKPEATEKEIKGLCKEAGDYQFKAVCVNSSWVSLCKKELKNTKVKVCSVVGFPLGSMSTRAKVYETRQAVKDGADEIDMVINIGRLKGGDYGYVKKEIRKVVKAARGKIVKVIIETCLLTDKEKQKACQLCVKAKADYIKTSTGFAGGGATANDVKLMKAIVKDKAEVKASGGIRDEQTALKMIKAGASRIGTSSGVKICQNV